TAAGGRIVLCAEAVVDDLVPAARNTRAFNLARRRAQSATHVRVEQERAGSRRARALNRGRWLVIGSGQLVKGAALALIGRLTGDLRRLAQGESRVASGLGELGGLVGIVSAPYARARRTRHAGSRTQPRRPHLGVGKDRADRPPSRRRCGDSTASEADHFRAYSR